MSLYKISLKSPSFMGCWNFFHKIGPCLNTSENRTCLLAVWVFFLTVDPDWTFQKVCFFYFHRMTNSMYFREHRLLAAWTQTNTDNTVATWLSLSQFWSIRIRQTTFLNNIKFADSGILGSKIVKGLVGKGRRNWIKVPPPKKNVRWFYPPSKCLRKHAFKKRAHN